jgi:2-amino-4-hydroxy-6-hydroxymethyldihydropteridine diphosphokinase
LEGFDVWPRQLRSSIRVVHVATPMSRCLIALGSNLGDRAATLEAAIAEIGAVDRVTVERTSGWYETRPVGGGAERHEYLNGAASIETSQSPRELRDVLQTIEARHFRQRTVRWADRTLDLDLLLYDDCVIDSPTLTLPHPRMSFRRFVLEPAVEIAPQYLHPTIGWTLERLLAHLDEGADRVAIVSRDQQRGLRLAEQLEESFSGLSIEAAPAGVSAQLWPHDLTTWVTISPGARGTDNHPKLSILLDSNAVDSRPNLHAADWEAISRLKGRGPTLQIAEIDAETASVEAFAAMQAVWPALGSGTGKRLE